MTRSVTAGAAYFAAMFAAGIVLGTLRVLVVMPRIGETPAVLLELPVMLWLSWVVAGWLTGRFGVAGRPGPRLVMGMVALVLLLLAEAVLATVGFGRTPAEHLAHYRTVAGAVGLAGQVVFGLVPVLRLWAGRS